jgi:hypothetical protein
MEARDRVEELEEMEEKYRNHGADTIKTTEIDQLRIMNDNLKQKLLQSVR